MCGNICGITSGCRAPNLNKGGQPMGNFGPIPAEVLPDLARCGPLLPMWLPMLAGCGGRRPEITPTLPNSGKSRPKSEKHGPETAKLVQSCHENGQRGTDFGRIGADANQFGPLLARRRQISTND